MTKKEICKENGVQKSKCALKKKTLIALVAFCLLSVSCMTVTHSRESVRVVIAEEGNLDAKDHIGTAALSWAAYYGHIEEVKALIEAGATLDLMDPDGFTALTWAIHSGQEEASIKVEAVKILIEAGADIEPLDRYTGRSPLMWASLIGETEIAKMLIEAGADVNIQEEGSDWNLSEDDDPAKGYTALILASYYGNTEIAKMLIEAGADVNIRTYAGRERIENPERTGFDYVAGLISASAGYEYEPDHYYKEWGTGTALIYAAVSGYPEIVKALIDAGANLNVQDLLFNYTALMYAVSTKPTEEKYEKSIEIVKLLLEAGANIWIKDDLGLTAYDIAYRIGRTHNNFLIVDLFEDAGVPAW